jgi:hypothetical protein
MHSIVYAGIAIGVKRLQSRCQSWSGVPESRIKMVSFSRSARAQKSKSNRNGGAEITYTTHATTHTSAPSFLHLFCILSASFLHPFCILSASFLHPFCILSDRLTFPVYCDSVPVECHACILPRLLCSRITRLHNDSVGIRSETSVSALYAQSRGRLREAVIVPGGSIAARSIETTSALRLITRTPW